MNSVIAYTRQTVTDEYTYSNYSVFARKYERPLVLNMKIKQIIAFSLLGLALANTANAGLVPTTIDPISGVSTIPLAIDWRFSDRGLTVSVASTSDGGFQLTATGAGNITLNGPSPDTSSYAGTLTGTGYSLKANFNSSSQFVFGVGTIIVPGLPNVFHYLLCPFSHQYFSKQ